MKQSQEDFERWRAKGRVRDQDTQEQHSSEFSRLIFCLIYPQLRVEAGKPGMSIGADKKNSQEKLPFLTKVAGKGDPSKTHNF